MNLLHEQVIRNYYVEKCIESATKQGLLTGSLHLSIGQEACDVGIINAFDNPLVFGNHRSHGQFLAATNNLDSLIIQLKNGMSQHLYAENKFISHGVQGGLCPIAVGNALAFKNKGIKRRVLCFIGDGTLAQGTFTESLYLASIYQAPITFIIIDNKYSMSNTKLPSCKENFYFVTDLIRAYNIKCYVLLDSRNVLGIYNMGANIDALAGPDSIYIRCNRLCGHSCSDTQVYRPKEELTKEYFDKFSPFIFSKNEINPVIAYKIKTEVIETFVKHLPEFKYVH
jgi:TPP-dependent pyruvate/acetoin dehydrogenase alpha subunit